MLIRVLYFAACREAAGTREESVEVPDAATVRGLRRRLERAHPALAAWKRSLRVAVNEQVAQGDRALREGDVVALLPPMSGGAPGDASITTRPIRPERLARELLADAAGAGALATFTGIVRPTEKGRRIRSIAYETYPGMAERTLEAVCDETRRKFAIRRVAIVHRHGEIPVGEAAVAIAVAADHRQEAFAACRFAIERLKKTVPIWKAEFKGGESRQPEAKRRISQRTTPV